MPLGAASTGFGVSFTLRDQFTAASKKISQSFKGLSGSAANFGGRLTKSADGMGAAFGKVAVITGLVAPFVAATRASSQFSAEISKLGALSQGTASEMKLLEQQALDLGAATKFSATEAAQGMSFLAMAGFKSNQIMEAMPGVLDLATVAQVDLAKASDIASNIMSGFGKKASEMDQIVDVLASTTSSSNLNLVQLAESMKLIAPQAKTLGVELEEVSAVVGILGDNGLQGTIATASMRTSINRLAKETGPVAKAMKELGVQAFDQTGKFKGLTGLVKELERVTTGMTDKQKLAAVATVVGSEASTQYLALMNATKTVMKDGTSVTLKGSEALQAYTENLKEATGAGKAMADQMMNNLQGRLIALGSQFETMLIKIGAAIEPLVSVLVEVATQLIQFFSWLASTAVGKVLLMIAAGIAMVAAGMIAWNLVNTIAIPIFTGLAAAVNLTLWPITLIIVAIVAVVFIMKKLYEAITKGAEGASMFGTALLFALGPIGAIIGGVLALKRGVSEFNAVADGADAKGGFLGFLTKLGGIVVGVMEIWKSATSEGFALSEKTRNALEKMGILQFVINLGTYVVRIKEFFRGVWQGIKESLIDPLADAWTSIGEAFGGLVDAISSIFDAIGFSIGKAGGKMETFKMIGKFVGKVVSVALMPIVWALQGIAFIVKTVIRLFTWLINKVKSLVGLMGGWLTSIKEVLGLIDETEQKNARLTGTGVGGIKNPNSATVLSDQLATSASNATQAQNNQQANLIAQGVNDKEVNITDDSNTTVTNQIVLDGEVIAATVNEINKVNSEIQN